MTFLLLKLKIQSPNLSSQHIIMMIPVQNRSKLLILRTQTWYTGWHRVWWNQGTRRPKLVCLGSQAGVQEELTWGQEIKRKKESFGQNGEKTLGERKKGMVSLQGYKDRRLTEYWNSGDFSLLHLEKGRGSNHSILSLHLTLFSSIYQVTLTNKKTVPIKQSFSSEWKNLNPRSYLLIPTSSEKT